MIAARSRWLRWGIVALLCAALLSSALFANRSYHTLLLLRAAYRVQAPDLSQVRPWMTMEYVSRLYGASSPALLDRLGLPADTNPSTTLKALAQQQGLAPFQYLQRVQQAVASVQPNAAIRAGVRQSGWWGVLGDALLAALLVYGYPVLALTLLLGSIGVPLPDGLLTIVAGSLIAQQRMGWAAAGAIAVAATVGGDLVGYWLGRLLSREFLERRGAWLGYTPARRQQAEGLFRRWGLVSVLLSRTLVSTVSPVVNLAAGASGYRLLAFASAVVAGRVLWTGAYLGLGFGVGGALEAAAGFLENLTGLLVSLLVLLWALLVAIRQASTHRAAP
jgi:membrane protein DedA with SNARE-associated domain